MDPLNEEFKQQIERLLSDVKKKEPWQIDLIISILDDVVKDVNSGQNNQTEIQRKLYRAINNKTSNSDSA